jgi:hypothetical protein
MRLWNCSDSVALFVFLFLWDFGTVLTVWHHLFFDRTLEPFQQCEMFFSIGHWNCSDSVALFIFLLDFGTVPTVWHYLLINWTLELFRECGIIGFSIGLWNCSDSVASFSMWLWNYSDNIALFAFLCGFGTVPTIWHYLVFYWTLELF